MGGTGILSCWILPSYASHGTIQTDDEHLHLSSSQACFQRLQSKNCFWFISFRNFILIQDITDQN